MKKYSVEWKYKKGIWFQRHGQIIFQHFIQYDTEYSKPTAYQTIKEAEQYELLYKLADVIFKKVDIL